MSKGTAVGDAVVGGLESVRINFVADFAGNINQEVEGLLSRHIEVMWKTDIGMEGIVGAEVEERHW